MPVSVRLEGVEAVIRQLQAVGQAVTAAAEDGCLKVAEGIAAGAAARTPVDTETLKRAWGAWKVKGGAVVGIKPDSERAALNRAGKLVFRDPQVYGPFVELGTARMEPRPMLRPAVDEAAANAPQVIAEVVERAVAQAVGK